MDPKTTVIVFVENTKATVRAQVVSNLALTFINASTVTLLKFVVRPVAGADTSFTDPITNRIFQIMGETSLRLTIGGPTASATVYVVNDEEIGVAMVLGMDTIIALQGTLFLAGDEQTNPLFDTTNGKRLPPPRPVLATGLPISLVSQAWASENEVAISQVEIQYYRDNITNTTFPVYGMVTIPSGNNACQAFVSNIKTSMMLGVNYLKTADFKLKFDGWTISWPQTMVVHPYRPPTRSIAGPTCPKCGLNGHVQSQCTGAREI
jgi:hypothetical protein